MDDLEQRIAPFREDAQKESIWVGAAAILVGMVVGLLVWKWSDLTFIGSHVIPSLTWGCVGAFIVLWFFGAPDPLNATAPDELLHQITTLTFTGSAAKDLRETLLQNGRLTLGEIEEAFEGERVARQRQKALEQPGAKALLRI